VNQSLAQLTGPSKEISGKQGGIRYGGFAGIEARTAEAYFVDA